MQWMGCERWRLPNTSCLRCWVRWSSAHWRVQMRTESVSALWSTHSGWRVWSQGRTLCRFVYILHQWSYTLHHLDWSGDSSFPQMTSFYRLSSVFWTSVPRSSWMFPWWSLTWLSLLPRRSLLNLWAWQSWPTHWRTAPTFLFSSSACSKQPKWKIGSGWLTCSSRARSACRRCCQVCACFLPVWSYLHASSIFEKLINFTLVCIYAISMVQFFKWATNSVQWSFVHASTENSVD